MPDQRISDLNPATTAQSSLPLPAGKVLEFATENDPGVSNLRVGLAQIIQNTVAQILSAPLNLKNTQTVTITIPAGFKFYVDSVAIIGDTVTVITVQPTVSAGNTADPTKYLAPTLLTRLTDNATRDLFAITGTDGETDLKFTVDTGATGTTLNGRVQFRGSLVPN